MSTDDSTTSTQDATADTTTTTATNTTPERTEGPTQLGQESEGPTNLSIGGIIAYLVGGATMLAGVAGIFDNPVMGIGLILVGVFGMPVTRRRLEQEANIKMSRWFATLAFLILLTLAGAIGTM